MVRLLIVEDRFFVAEAMRDTLADCGFEVVGMTGLASRAMTLAARERPNLALVDVLLGDDVGAHPDGVELATRLRRELGVPSLFVTGAKELLHGDEGVGCVTKPCSHAQLVEAVEASLLLIEGGVPPANLPEGVQLWPRSTAREAARTVLP